MRKEAGVGGHKGAGSAMEAWSDGNLGSEDSEGTRAAGGARKAWM